MVPLDDHLHAFLDLRQHGVRIASEFSVANVERSHIHDDTSLKADGGPDRTRICDLYRVKVAANDQAPGGGAQAILVPMTVQLSLHGQELLEAALARGVGRSPEEVVERALEAASGIQSTLSNEELERRSQAVASMVAFREEYHLTLGPGERIQDLIHEDHKY